MKKVGIWVFVILFWMFCLVPSAGMLFYNGELAENRDLSMYPAFRQDDGTWNSDYFQELQTYVAEHFAFRGELVEVESRLKYVLLHTPGNDQVIIGKDGWLFFEETLTDYAGIRLDDAEIDRIADKLYRVCCYIRSKGKEPLIVIVPNKNSIYPEYMPARFGSGNSGGNLIRLQECMKTMDVPFVDAYHIMLGAKKANELYLHEDTHWNNTGARLILNEIYAVYGLSDWYDLEDYTVEEIHRPDLYGILFPTDGHYEEQHIYHDLKTYDYIGRMHSEDDMMIRTVATDGNGKSILVYRDSFGRALIPCMGGTFDSVVFNRSTPYDLSLVESEECDCVLIEIVERNLQELGDIEIP